MGQEKQQSMVIASHILPLSLKELGKQGKQNYPRFRGGETEARAGDSSERAKAVTELASKPQ